MFNVECSMFNVVPAQCDVRTYLCHVLSLFSFFDSLLTSIVMNGVTHGLGIILCVIGAMLMHDRVKDESANKRIRYVTIVDMILIHIFINADMISREPMD